jgi:hypothetical protein
VGGTNRLLSFDTNGPLENYSHNSSVTCVFVASVLFLLSRHKDWLAIFTRHAVEIGIAAFMKTGSDIQKFVGSVRHNMAIVSADFNFFK